MFQIFIPNFFINIAQIAVHRLKRSPKFSGNNGIKISNVPILKATSKKNTFF